MKQNPEIEFKFKRLNELNRKDTYLFFEGEGILYRYITLKQTWIHKHNKWVFKRVDDFGYIMTRSETDSQLQVLVIDWNKITLWRSKL